MLHGGTFRGPLRKATYAALRALIAEAKGVDESQVFSLRDAYMLGQGVDITRDVQNESKDKTDPVSEARLRATNPMLSMFGRWRLPGRLSVGEMRTDANHIMTVAQGARADMFQRDPDEIEYLSDNDQQTLLRQLDSAKQTQSQIDDNSGKLKQLRREAGQHKRAGDDAKAKTLYDEANQISETIKALKNSREGAEESIQHPLAGVEAIAPGTELSHRMTLLDDDLLGLLLVGLRVMARTPFLGGHRNTGCGEFSAEWNVLQWNRGQATPHSIGSVAITPDGFKTEGDALWQEMVDFEKAVADYQFNMHTLAQIRDTTA
jgi:hypothetical protein